MAEAQFLPERTVFVGDILAKMVVDKTTLRPDAIPELERRNETVRLTIELLEEGWVVVGSTEYNDPYRVWIDAHPRVRVEQGPGDSLWTARLVA